MPYQVTLPIYQGPLDLLLHLIEKDELPITEVSLAAVTDQFLTHLAEVEQRDPAHLADFLAIAARLLLIKSQALLPRPARPENENEEDVAGELARQLEAYRLIKRAAERLREWENADRRSYPRAGRPPRPAIRPRVEGLSLARLSRAMQHCLPRLSPPPLAPTVGAPAVTIEEKIAAIRTIMSETDYLPFSTLLEPARTRVEIVVTFLAVLELVRQRFIMAEQEGLFAEIVLRRGVRSPA